MKNKLVNETKELVFVIAPASNHPSGLDLRALTDYLSKEIGIPIHTKQCGDYEDAIKALLSGEAQIGWLGPFAFREAAGREGIIEAFAVGIPKGKTTPNYHSLFIVKSDSKLKMLEDVRNSSIGLSDEYSLSLIHI